jgi:hypothetical protein
MDESRKYLLKKAITPSSEVSSVKPLREVVQRLQPHLT